MSSVLPALLEEGATSTTGDDYLSATHGFLPTEPPCASLPSSHAAWDQAAAALPELMAKRTVQRALDELPELSDDDIGEEHLVRAALVLGMLAHAYVRDGETGARLYVSLGARGPQRLPIPEVIMRPWTSVCRRLGRRAAALTYGDIILSNWCLRDAAGPRDVENLDVLVPALGNQEERVFYTTMVETHARAAPLVAAASRLHATHEPDVLREVLEAFLHGLRDITFRTLLKIDPNPHAPTYVDPLVWAKTVAPFAAPTHDEEPGLSGAGSPLFPMLDAFFGRAHFDSSIGHESLTLTSWLPRRQRDFVRAITCPKDAARELGLEDLYREAWEAYAGKRGWLGVHRLKVYGFMELGFKAGRTQTNGGFTGQVETRAWEELDDKMEQARAERPRPAGCPMARIKASHAVSDAAHEVVLEGPKLHHAPGDRMGVLPRHRPELVDKTLAALNAHGHEPVQLTALWRDALASHHGPSISTGEGETLPLRTFLEHAALRPLARAVVRALYALTRSPGLLSILEQRREDELELWDAIEVMARENYDVKRLWKAPPWHRESIARIVPPARFRIYSLSSSDGDLRLTVGPMSFQSPAASTTETTQRVGAASHMLVADATECPVPVQVVRPSRFRLPEDPRVPIVMCAGGTGVAPFRGFLEARARGAGENWLFLGTATPASLPYREDLERMAVEGHVHLHVAFSREDVTLVRRDDGFQLEPGARAYIGTLMDAQAPALWELLQRGAYFYVCGQTAVAHSVMEALHRMLARFLADPSGAFRRLCAEGRLMFDVFTTFASSTAPGLLGNGSYGASELARHNNDTDGWWIAIGGNVYDVSEFMHLHPGGHRLLMACAGTDATASYERVEHHLNAEVHAMLDLYKVGQLRRLDFQDVWGMALVQTSASPTQQEAHAHTDGPASSGLSPRARGVVYLTLHDLYRHWVRALYAVVEVENSLHNNLALGRVPLRTGEAPGTPSALRDALLEDTHAIFATSYVPMLLGERMDFLWRVTTGMCAPDEPITRLSELMRSARGEPPRDAQERRARAFAGELKLALSEGVRVFERHQADTVAHGGRELVDVLLRVPEIAQRFYAS